LRSPDLLVGFWGQERKGEKGGGMERKERVMRDRKGNDKEVRGKEGRKGEGDKGKGGRKKGKEGGKKRKGGLFCDCDIFSGKTV